MGKSYQQLSLINDAMDANLPNITTDGLGQGTTATQLFNHLYQACNILHGHIGHEDFKSYIIPLLFSQRIL